MGNRKDYPTAEHVKAVTSTLERYTCEEHAVLNDTHQQPYDCVACEAVLDVRNAIALIERLDAALTAERRAHKRLSKSLDSAYRSPRAVAVSRREFKTWSTK